MAADKVAESGKPGKRCHFPSTLLLLFLSPSLPTNQPTEATPAAPKHLTAVLMMPTPGLSDRLQTSGGQLMPERLPLNLDQHAFDLIGSS